MKKGVYDSMIRNKLIKPVERYESIGEAHEMAPLKRCVFCRHEDIPVFEPPCASCSGTYLKPNWELAPEKSGLVIDLILSGEIVHLY